MGCNSEDLYAILGVSRNCDSQELKRAYYKKALLYHPDRNSEVNSNKKFQGISFAYEVLSNPSNRDLYDKTGSVDGFDEASIAELMRSAHEKVTITKLKEFKEYYIGSSEELEDLLAAYMKYNGDMASIINSVFYGDVSKQERYFALISRCIKKGIVPQYTNFAVLDSVHIKKSQKRAKKEAAEAELMLQDLLSKNPEYSDLQEGILSKRRRDNDALIARLEQKYAPKTKYKPRK